MQYRDTLGYETIIQPSDWHNEGTEYVIVIPAKNHKKASPTAKFYIGIAPHFEETLTDVHVDEDENVSLRISTEPLAGKVVIK